MRRKLAAGNWKMNGSLAALAELDAIAAAPAGDIERVICPPAPYLAAAAQRCAGTPLEIGAQDCHAEASGAHTGDISAKMLAETGARHVILGHSERRAAYRETCASVRAKSIAAHAAGLAPIICLGESQSEREAGAAQSVIARQLKDSLPDSVDASFIIAYEPIWAIGSGLSATPQDIAEIHSAIRAGLTARFGSRVATQIRILYGGSVKPDNAAATFAARDVDGALIGGASLKASDFNAIVAHLAAA